MGPSAELPSGTGFHGWANGYNYRNWACTWLFPPVDDNWGSQAVSHHPPSDVHQICQWAPPGPPGRTEKNIWWWVEEYFQVYGSSYAYIVFFKDIMEKELDKFSYSKWCYDLTWWWGHSHLCPAAREVPLAMLGSQIFGFHLMFFLFPQYHSPLAYVIQFPTWFSDKESSCQCRRHGLNAWVGKIPGRKKRQPTPVFFPGKSH